jgi:hypothetical protein
MPKVETEKNKNAGAQNPTYPLSELLAQSQALFGCNPEVIRGALTGVSQTDFTVEELKKRIDNFQKRRVTN